MDVEGEHLTDLGSGVTASGTGHHETADPPVDLRDASDIAVPRGPPQHLHPPLGPILSTQGVQVVVRHRAPIRGLPGGDMNLTELRRIVETRRT